MRRSGAEPDGVRPVKRTTVPADNGSMDPVATLSRLERRLLRISKERGFAPFVIAVTLMSIGLSLAISLIAMWFMGADRAELIATIVIATAVPGLVAPAITSAIGRLLLALDRASSELHTLSRTDALTGALNRRAFAADAAALLDDHGGRAVVVAMIDVDDFKGVNDRHGHPAGDAVLVRLAHALADAAGPDGVVGRFGGDEFALVRPVDDQGTAAVVAAIEAACDLGAVVRGVRASLGVATITPHEDIGLDGALTRADHALYRVKHRRDGRTLTPT